MTATLAKEQIAIKVLKHTEQLCEALKDDFKRYSIRSHFASIARAIQEGDQQSVIDYHNRCIDDIKDEIGIYQFVIESGRKYHKIVMITEGGARSVHAFVDKKTGEVYKSASWKSPAKGVRYNLLMIPSREECLMRADWSGSYLYLR
jgi:hypothetical protein